MNQLPYPLFVSDIDGTLITDHHTIPAANQESIDKFRSLGGQFTLATGRSYVEAKRYIEALDVQLPVILCNGGVLFDPQRDTLTPIATMEQRLVHAMAQQLQEVVPTSDILIYTLERIYTTHLHSRTITELEGFQLPDFPLEVLSSFSMLPKLPWIKISVFTQPHLMKSLYQWAATKQVPLSFVQSSPSFFEILPPRISKGNGLLSLMNTLGIRPQQAAVIGDHLNDLSMVHTAGLSAAVANAHPKILHAAKHIVPSNIEAGVSTFLEDYVLTPLAPALKEG